MKKIFILTAITIISAVAVNNVSAQYYGARHYGEARHERAEGRYYGPRFATPYRDVYANRWAYGNQGAYGYNRYEAVRPGRDMRYGHRDAYRGRRRW